MNKRIRVTVEKDGNVSVIHNLGENVTFTVNIHDVHTMRVVPTAVEVIFPKFKPYCQMTFTYELQGRDVQGICHRPRGHENEPGDVGHSEFPKEGDWPSKERMPSSD